MKILMFGWEFPPFNSGGLGVACQGLSKALAALNIKITFVLPRKIDIKAPYIKTVFANDGLKFREIDSLLLPYLNHQSYNDRFGLPENKIYGRDLLEEVRRYALSAGDIAKNEEFDLIHAHDWLSFGAGIEAKRISGKPLIVHVHATEFDRCGNNPDPRILKIEKEGMEAADKIIAVSLYTKQMIIDHYGIDPSKIEVVWNGIDAADYDGRAIPGNSILKLKEIGNKIVIFVGRITFQKGPDYFLQAAKKVLEFDPNVIFLVTGSGDMENQVISQSAELGISDKVLFAGFQRGENLQKIYQAADLFVLSSVSEPFGITTLESMINGTPVLVSNQSGVAEALTHALKVDFWDIDKMAKQILEVLNNPVLADSLSSNGKAEAKSFTWQKAAQRCLEIYNLVKGRRT
jgi:glycogen synthase